MIYFIGGVMALTGIFKLVGGDPEGMFENSNTIYILAIIEFIVAAAIFLPSTRTLGVILAASYIGGIIAFSWLVEKEMPIPGIVLNTILYAGAAMHWPRLTTADLR